MDLGVPDEFSNNKKNKALKQAQYAEQLKFKSSLGLKRGQKASKISQPCKCLYELRGRGYTSNKVSSECWAHEYTDAKGAFKAPHTCQYLHPGEEGWKNEWNKLNVPRVSFRTGPSHFERGGSKTYKQKGGFYPSVMGPILKSGPMFLTLAFIQAKRLIQNSAKRLSSRKATRKTKRT